MVTTSRQFFIDHLEQKRKEEKAKEETTLKVNKNGSEDIFAHEQYQFKFTVNIKINS